MKAPKRRTSRTFYCAMTGRNAGSIELLEGDKGAEIRRDSFTSKFVRRVEPDSLIRVRNAIAAGDVLDLFSYDIELVPFYCPKCNASFCGEFWKMFSMMMDGTTRFEESARMATRGCWRIEPFPLPLKDSEFPHTFP